MNPMRELRIAKVVLNIGVGEAGERLGKAETVRENRLPAYCFSKTGGVSFGIPDYTGFKNENYDPDIGIFGLDIAVAFERPGYRVARRKIKHNKIGKNHRINAEECQEYMTKKFNLEVFKI